MADTPAPHKSSIKETLTSITIAFILAFVFRAFIIEAFVIPTGSMAPTLMGAHVRVHSDRTGYTWPVGPADYTDPSLSRPTPLQSATVRDPMLGQSRESLITFDREPIRAGDRILVLKYLAGVFDPERFDVVVFKSPEDPQTNFIKRLVGLPGEQIALIDGDVFHRPADAYDPDAVNAWAGSGWQIARKPERVQREVWQPVFDSAWTPPHPEQDGRRWFYPPWIGDDAWNTEGRTYRYDGAGPTALAWDADRWPIRDRYAYDETMRDDRRQDDRFPVSDLRMRAGIQPDATLNRVSAVIDARGHEFRADIDADGTATIRMRPLADENDWTVLAETETGRTLRPGHVTNVEFWHVDQSLELRIEGDLVAAADYDWSPEQRVLWSTGETVDDLLGERHFNIFMDPRIYRTPAVRWEFDGAPVELHRVALERDLFYQPSRYPSNHQDGTPFARAGQPAAGTHPYQPLVLTDRQFFCCGDNSPASSDGRLWDSPDPWVALIDETIGVVPKELMIGRAFLVYFPSPVRRFGLPIPDAGHLRLIW